MKGYETQAIRPLKLPLFAHSDHYNMSKLEYVYVHTHVVGSG